MSALRHAPGSLVSFSRACLWRRSLAAALRTSLNLRSVGSKYVWLLGRLNKPGLYATAGGMSLLEALSLAGGTAHSTSQSTSVEEADLRHSFVVRQGQFLPVDFHKLLREGDLSQ